MELKEKLAEIERLNQIHQEILSLDALSESDKRLLSEIIARSVRRILKK